MFPAHPPHVPISNVAFGTREYKQKAVKYERIYKEYRGFASSMQKNILSFICKNEIKIVFATSPTYL